MRYRMRIYASVLLAALLILSCFLAGCSGDSEEPSESETEITHYTVSFDSQGGSSVPSARVEAGGRVSEPAAPTLENRVFKGWFYNGYKWDFSKRVSEDMTLVAQWESATERFLYTTKDGVATITGIKTTTEKKLVIPATIAGFPVTAIGESAFADISAETVTSLTLPSTVTTVGAYAFQGCADIEIDLSAASLTFVGEGAFEDCSGLRSVSFGEGMTEIAPSAFLLCASLTSVQIPSTVTVIGESAFEGCENLSSILIPASVERIENSAFRDCMALTTLLYGGGEEALALLLENTDPTLNECFFEVAEEACFYSETEPVGEGSYWHYDESRLPKIW